MLSLLTLSLIFLVALPVVLVGMVLLSVPFLVIMGLLPWLLRVAAVLLLLRALMEHPFHLANFAPAAIAFLLSVLLG